MKISFLAGKPDKQNIRINIPLLVTGHGYGV